MKLEWTRATMEISGPCICGERTNRVFAFKQPEEKNYQSVFICDDCADGIRNAPVKKPADG